MTNKALITLWCAVFIGYLDLGATVQAIPGYVTGTLHASMTLAGLAVGIAFAATAVFRPLAGWLADAAHSRIVVCCGACGTAVGGAGHLFAGNVREILLARIIMGAGEAALFSGAIPWVLASVPAAEKGKIAGWFGMSMWGGLALGPILASSILLFQSIHILWMIVTLLGVISCILVLGVRQPQVPSDIRSHLTMRGLFPRGSILPGTVFGLSAYGYGCINAIIVLFLMQIHSNATHYVLTVFAGTFLVCRFFGSPLITRLGGKTIWTITLGLESLGLCLIGIAVCGAPGVVLGAAITGAGLALMFPATVAVTLGRTGRMAPGTSVAVMTSFWDIGLMIAGPLSGYIAEKIDFTGVFMMAMFMSILALIIGVCTGTTISRREIEVLPTQVESKI